MKKLLGFCIALVFVSMSAYSQKEGSSYTGAIGARLGTGYHDLLSVSYKTFVSNQGAIEINGGFGASSKARYYYNGNYNNYGAFTISASGSYQHHFNIPVEGLRWFVGGGFTVANSFSDYPERKGFGFGLFPTGGVDYKFAKIPLNVTADFRPTYFIKDLGGFNAFQASVGASARYTFR